MFRYYILRILSDCLLESFLVRPKVRDPAQRNISVREEDICVLINRWPGNANNIQSLLVDEKLCGPENGGVYSHSSALRHCMRFQQCVTITCNSFAGATSRVAKDVTAKDIENVADKSVNRGRLVRDATSAGATGASWAARVRRQNPLLSLRDRLA